MSQEDKNITEVTPQEPVQENLPADAIQKAKPLRGPLVKRFDRYIIKNFLGTYVFAILLLAAIVVMFDINEKLDAVLTAPIKATVFQYFMNFLPFIISQFSPLFTFISVIFFTSRLADRSEIIAMLSSGITFKRLAVPYMMCAALIAALSFVLMAYVIPPANQERIAYTNRWVKNKEVTYADNIQVQVRPGVMAYISRYDNTTRTGFRFSLEQFDGKTMKSRLTAESIRYDTLGRWTLNSYTLRNFNGLKEKMTQGTVLDTLLNLEPRDFLISKNDEQMLTSPQLREYIDRQKARGVANIKNFEIEYERRYAMTAAAFILTIIGLSLSSRKVRGGMGLNIGIGLLLSFSYILFMTVTSTFAVSGYTSARVAMWIPNILYTLIAIYLYRRASR
ncbi:MAG: LptF/LptG family permease [Muribaculaceae bacterium]|nr:LptF/LptG family permease [Muribaculaceae bacterium]